MNEIWVEPEHVECRPRSAAKSFLDGAEYRLTAKGMAIAKDGLPDLAVAPQIAVGGFVAYAPETRWGCEVSDRDWRFVRSVAGSRGQTTTTIPSSRRWR